MARKQNTETTVLLQARQAKINEMSAIETQIEHLRTAKDRLNMEIDSLDFALSVLNPEHVSMHATASSSGRLLIEAQPDNVEATAIDVTPSSDADVKTKAPVGKAAKIKKSSSSKASKSGKSEAVPASAVKAAKSVSKKATQTSDDKEQIARSVINGYMKNLKPMDEIETIIRTSETGLTVAQIADKFLATHPLQSQADGVHMILKNRISSNINHLMKKGKVEKGKAEGETLTQYRYTGN